MYYSQQAYPQQTYYSQQAYPQQTYYPQKIYPQQTYYRQPAPIPPALRASASAFVPLSSPRSSLRPAQHSKALAITTPKIKTLSVSNVATIINSNAQLQKINNAIATRTLLTTSVINEQTFDYIVDNLNIERGVSSFRSISKLLQDPKNNLKNNKLLIITRAIMKKQSSEEDVECKRMVKENNNVKIIYIHTNYDVDGVDTKLIESCVTSTFCTNEEQSAGRTSMGEKLCVTPIIANSGSFNLRPMHEACEIDDLLTFYFALLYKSKIISKTEDYSLTMSDTKVRAIRIFMNIPISYYTHDAKLDAYIDPLKIADQFVKLLKEQKFVSSRSVRLDFNPVFGGKRKKPKKKPTKSEISVRNLRTQKGGGRKKKSKKKVKVKSKRKRVKSKKKPAREKAKSKKKPKKKPTKSKKKPKKRVKSKKKKVKSVDAHTESISV